MRVGPQRCSRVFATLHSICVSSKKLVGSVLTIKAFRLRMRITNEVYHDPLDRDRSRAYPLPPYGVVPGDRGGHPRQPHGVAGDEMSRRDALRSLLGPERLRVYPDAGEGSWLEGALRVRLEPSAHRGAGRRLSR